jgi:hypothetical protein
MSLTDADYARAALLLGCNPAAIRAVAEVEAPGSGFLPDGRPKILFEAHHFSRLTAHRFDADHPSISSRVWDRTLYRGGAAEHDRLARAAELDREAALLSCSWGKFQIMASNYKKAGFTSLQAFVNAMYRSEAEHLTAFCHFVKNMGLDDELRRLDWAPFARVFNGPKYAEHRYDERLAQAFTFFDSIDTLNSNKETST